MTLTVKAIEAAKPKDKPYKLADVAGLYLYVAPTGRKVWRCNYQKNGKQSTRTYGRWPELSLAQARQEHLLAKQSKNEIKSPAFEVVAKDWLGLKLPTLSNPKQRIQMEKTLYQYVFPLIGKIPIADLKRADLVDVARKAQEGGKVETAHRIASRITAIFNFAQDVGILEMHPASNLTRILAPRKIKNPMASIPPEEAGQLMKDIEQYPDLMTRLGLQLLAHTFVRVGELRLMQWDEEKEEGAIWVVPEKRMKMGKPHVVPLSTQAQSILGKLREMTGDGVLVFDSPANPGHAISENTLLFALYRMGYKGRMTAHGFRSLASSVLNEQSGFAPDVIERQLAHGESNAVRAAYNRAMYLDARRQLMQWWGDWLDGDIK